MLGFDEVKVLDINSEALGIPTSTLMENAGRGVAEFIIDRIIGSDLVKNTKPEIGIFCGPGNNGGDGFVAARYLTKAATIKIILTVPTPGIKTTLARKNFEKISSEVEILEKPRLEDVLQVLNKTDVIVDAMLGVGITGELREPYTDYIRAIEQTKSPLVSVDAPTGLGTKSALKPKFTVTFHAKKIGMTEENSGEIIVVPIGIPVEAEKYIGPGELVVYYPRPARNSHKGQNGRLLIVGGGPYTGAPALAGLAALRTGVDLVHIATPTRSYRTITGFSPDLIVHELEHSGGNIIGTKDLEIALELSNQCQAEDTFEFVRQMLVQCKIPIVLDADGLSAINSGILEDANKPKTPLIVTPHFTEFQRLSQAVLERDGKNSNDALRTDQVGNPEFENHLKEVSSNLGAVIVLKGKEDMVCDSKQLKYNRSGNPGMTVGGTGDVLAGIIGALTAKKIDLYNSARLGVFINGSAGDMVWNEKGPGLTASDIIDAIPRILTNFISF
jgi:NAD(P)H-hydrate epimerase